MADATPFERDLMHPSYSVWYRFVFFRLCIPTVRRICLWSYTANNRLNLLICGKGKCKNTPNSFDPICVKTRRELRCDDPGLTAHPPS